MEEEFFGFFIGFDGKCKFIVTLNKTVKDFFSNIMVEEAAFIYLVKENLKDEEIHRKRKEAEEYYARSKSKEHSN